VGHRWCAVVDSSFLVFENQKNAKKLTLTLKQSKKEKKKKERWVVPCCFHLVFKLNSRSDRNSSMCKNNMDPQKLLFV